MHFGFNSIKGTIKTNVIIIKPEHTFSFNSIKGTIKTSISIIFSCCKYVSIP